MIIIYHHHHDHHLSLSSYIDIYNIVAAQIPSQVPE